MDRILRDVDAEARTRLGLGPEPLALSDSDTEDQAPTHKLSSSTTIAPNRIKELLLQHKRRREAKVVRNSGLAHFPCYWICIRKTVEAV